QQQEGSDVAHERSSGWCRTDGRPVGKGQSEGEALAFFCACNRRERCGAWRSKANGLFVLVRPETAGAEESAKANEACFIVETPAIEVASSGQSAAKTCIG